MTMLAVNENTLQTNLKQQGVTLVDFGATWCPPCKVLKPILDELGNEYGDKLTVLEVDCDESPDAASEFGVMSMPTVIAFHNGVPVEKLVGLRPKAVYENLIAKYM
ncbi:thioredoxin family protein [Cohnella herbarum]|uniref:Thioredoxin n=1 Tax=Cohnella herbarum TaxID=2728023 RepID=A0A7Z2ZK62_9BACL|nr:thioredoxin family protein [Cohnella herbarum]QJD82628.1 thioredoxin family protein [Cohnella herbarum]